MPPNEPQPCSKHVLTTNVLDDLEKSRDTISKILADAEGLEKVRDIFNHIERLDISMIEGILDQMVDILFPRIQTHRDLEYFFGFRDMPNLSEGEDFSLYAFIQLRGLIRMALEEIFPLVCMHVNSGFSKKKLKSLVYLGMRHGSKNTICSVFYGDRETMFSTNGEKNFPKLFDNMLIEKKEPLNLKAVLEEKQDYQSQAICPFPYNEKYRDFIDMIWNLFELEVIPILRKKFQNSPNLDEQFFSGNL